MPDRQSLAFIDTSAVGGGGGGRGLGGKALPPRRNLGGARGAAGRSPGDGPDEGDELEELVMLENALDGNGGRTAWDEGLGLAPHEGSGETSPRSPRPEIVLFVVEGGAARSQPLSVYESSVAVAPGEGLVSGPVPGPRPAPTK